ncbi:MAG: N-acetylmuramoyl-L-alanine amidase [Pseudomonadota bacterium]
MGPFAFPRGSGLIDAIWHPSPNFGPRRDGLRPTLIVLHYTVMTPAEVAIGRLCDPEHEVSAHYVIGECGTLWKLVDEEMRAWHAGAGSWKGQEDINSRSIGIEMVNDGQSPYAEPLMATLEALLPEIMKRWDIPREGVIGHSDMAPGRKIDPGPHFDWARLEAKGLAAFA